VTTYNGGLFDPARHPLPPPLWPPLPRSSFSIIEVFLN